MTVLKQCRDCKGIFRIPHNLENYFKRNSDRRIYCPYCNHCDNYSSFIYVSPINKLNPNIKKHSKIGLSYYER